MSEDLHDQHAPAAIHKRLSEPRRQSYVEEAVLGGIDGCVTTMAVISGATGAALPAAVAAVLGLANMVADGFSMAVGTYEAKKAAEQRWRSIRDEEARHIDLVPDGEREEVRQIYRRNGFEGDLLDQVVDVVCADRERWINTMMREEHGFEEQPRAALGSAFATFAAFVGFGALPLIPVLLGLHVSETRLWPADAIAVLTFASVGYLRGVMTLSSPWKSALRMSLVGTTAAALSYLIGYLFKGLIG